jgi:hypothetical protein
MIIVHSPMMLSTVDDDYDDDDDVDKNHSGMNYKVLDYMAVV